MTDKINAKMFEEGLLDLSSQTSNSGGETQELELSSDLTDGLTELSELHQDQQQL